MPGATLDAPEVKRRRIVTRLPRRLVTSQSNEDGHEVKQVTSSGHAEVTVGGGKTKTEALGW